MPCSSTGGAQFRSPYSLALAASELPQPSEAYTQLLPYVSPTLFYHQREHCQDPLFGASDSVLLPSRSHGQIAANQLVLSRLSAGQDRLVAPVSSGV